MTKLLDIDDYYEVDFGGTDGSYERFVDLNAQADPQAYVAKLNSPPDSRTNKS